MKLGSVLTLLEEVERTYADTGRPIDPKLREAYDEVKAEADACLKAFDERLETEEIMAEHRRDRRRLAWLLAVVAAVIVLATVGMKMGWIK